jgi:hypothetical protein
MGLSQISARGVFPAEGCRSCAILQSVASRQLGEESPYVVEATNEGAVVLSGPELTGLVVLPRECVGGIEELSPPHRAEVLAAVRLATRLVREGCSGTDSRIVVKNDSSDAAGHVSFEVVPDAPCPASAAPVFTHAKYRS